MTPDPSHDAGDARPVRPDHFSTYVPRGLVRRLKVVATIRDIPLWAVVTAALEAYLDEFQKQYGKLPAMEERSSLGKES